MKITARDHDYKRHPQFRKWVLDNRLQLCLELTQVGDSLTEWTGKFYVHDSDGKIMIQRTADSAVPVIQERKVTTTPAERRWLNG